MLVVMCRLCVSALRVGVMLGCELLVVTRVLVWSVMLVSTVWDVVVAIPLLVTDAGGFPILIDLEGCATDLMRCPVMPRAR